MDCYKCKHSRIEEAAGKDTYFLRCFAQIPKWGNGYVVDIFKGDVPKRRVPERPAWCKEDVI